MLKKHKISFFLFLSFAFIYYIGSFSKVPFGDCIGFVVETEKSKFLFSTSTYSHFLFTNTLILLKKIFPFFESPEIARSVIVLSATFCVVILHKIVLQISKDQFFSIFSVILFGFSFSFWKNAEIVEVYTFNLVFVGLFIHYSVLFLLKKDRRYLFLATLFLASSFWVHIQNILMIPGWFLLLYFNKNFKNSIISISIFGFLFLGLIAVPILTKESVSSIFSSGVVFRDLQFSTLLLSFSRSIGYLIYNFWYFIIFLIFGCIYLFKDQLQTLLFLAITSLPIFLFATTFGVSDNYVFFIPFNFAAAIFIGLGAFYLKEKIWIKKICFTALFIPLFYFISFKIISQTEKGKQIQKEKAYKGGLAYFLLPWMNDNIGIIEFTIDKKDAPEPIDWMTDLANQYIKILRSKNYTEQEIKEL